MCDAFGGQGVTGRWICPRNLEKGDVRVNWSPGVGGALWRDLTQELGGGVDFRPAKTEQEEARHLGPKDIGTKVWRWDSHLGNSYRKS